MSRAPSSSTCQKCGAIYVCVPGEPASKANSRKLVKIRGKMVSVKSDKALALERTWRLVCPRIEPLITGDVAVHFWLAYASRRPDLDESLIMDLIQGKLIANDRQIKIKHVYWLLDQNDPGVELVVKRIGTVDCDNDTDCLMKDTVTPAR